MTSAIPRRRKSRDDESSATDILVVDDNPRNLLAIDAALGSHAGRVVKASSGEDALRALLRQDFAVILLDVQMPGLDGFETAALIRTRDRCKHTPIIFVTAFDQRREEVLRGYQLGAVDFLFKPIVPEILKAKVAAFVELRKQVAEIARQDKLLREHEAREREERMLEERRQWEAELLRRTADESADRAEQLAVIVAERERAQAELTRVVEKLETADRRKDQFLATLAHELRTPLSPISIGIDLVHKLVPDDAEVQRVLTLMRRQSRHLVRLVDDLLEASRISRGKVSLQRGPFLLGEAVEQAAQMCEPLIAERQHTLVIPMRDDTLCVDGDRVRLTQVVSNLLTNAARYTPPGGRIQLSCERDGGEAVIRVVDNGRGMTAELMERVFDIFVQGGGNEEHCGLGIGLSLVKQLVTLHGGSVSAHSEGLGQGSAFSVRLPLAAHDVEPAAPSETGTHTRDVTAAVPARVLLVEDNEDIRELTISMLRRGGHLVEEAPDGHTALALAETHRFDIVLVDIGLPDMGGVEVGRLLRPLVGARTRMIAVTGYGHADVRNEAAAAGFDAYLVKPVSERDLAAEIATAEREQGSAEHSA